MKRQSETASAEQGRQAHESATAALHAVPTTAAVPVPAVQGEGLVARARERIRGGEFGSWPVVIGLIVIWVVFQSLNDRFLTPQNLSNLTLQIASTGAIAVGVVLVLLLGEIDLSVGSVSGLAGAVLGALAVRQGLPPVVAMVVAIAIGVMIGTMHGTIFTKLAVPSFVVTLAGLIGWQGLQLYVLKPQGTINFPYEGFIARLTQTTFVPAMGWLIGAAIVACYTLALLWNRRRRTLAGLAALTTRRVLLRAGGLALGVVVTVAVLNAWNGVPLALLIFIGFVVAFDLLLRRTRYGRSIYAIGGDIEAARRAGINVDAIRISVFALASGMAAIGGILAASRGFSVGQTSGGSDVLLQAIAAAVIGGTSLFGGRGTPYSALLGMLVLGSITSGMLLLQLESDVRFMITAAVLLAAVIIDSFSRRGRRATGG